MGAARREPRRGEIPVEQVAACLLMISYPQGVKDECGDHPVGGMAAIHRMTILFISEFNLIFIIRVIHFEFAILVQI